MAILDKYFAMGLESVACNLCGAVDDETLADDDRFGGAIRAAICRRCGLIYLNPRWTPAAYDAFYEADYRDLMGERREPPREVELRQRAHGARLLEFCGPFVPRASKVLDIGCGAGGVLSAFSLAGYPDLHGVEPSLEQSAYCRDTLGLGVHTGMFGDAPLAAGSFDLIILTQTLNHFLNPRGELEQVRRLLRPGGWFFLEVQNFPEFAKRVKRPFQVDHTYYFGPETLECMARRVGFEPVRVEVDTAGTAAAVHPYMWHRSASLHVRMLLRQAPPEQAALPDYRPLRDEVLRARRRRQGVLGGLWGLWRRRAA